MKKIILASGSPRRRELMADMGLSFTVDSSTSFVEVIPEGMAPENVPAYFAEGKSLGFHRPIEDDELIVTADTVVICNGEIMGKPSGKKGAREMLRKLSGHTHNVVSAVCVRTKDSLKVVSDTSHVTFREFKESEIDYYVDNYCPTDKAGAYGIQEWIGLVASPRIEGSFYTIMGLPTHILYSLLNS